jgi:hypothetical protein
MLTVTRNGCTLRLDQRTGQAELDSLWTGTLYPAFWVVAEGKHRLLTVRGEPVDGGVVALDLDGHGTGRAVWRETPVGLDLAELSVELDPALRIVDMFFGASPLAAQEQTAAPDLEHPFWPDWRADGFCVPSGRPAPAKSFFRRWDLGHARLPLGSFGPAMGGPYAAAFPRPLYAAAMGGDRGWLVAGTGTVPDAALTLEVRSSSAALRWRYREDLWGTGTRSWPVPLRLAWHRTAWDAYAAYFATFPVPRRRPAAFAVWNTWGDFRAGDTRLGEIARAAVDLECEVLAIDDGWETQVSSGAPDRARFPRFDADLAQARALGLRIGFWQAVGWIDDPAAVGLTDDDLLRGADGRPRRANWALDPRDPAQHYCLDPSSEGTRRFLTERTERLVRSYRPAILKLDFGYGLPGPDVAAPADPAWRGERLGHELYRIVVEAARRADPDVAIQLYGVHPLHLALTDILALDDMGDHGAVGEGQGHRQWSVWAALAGARGIAVNGSSGYQWDQDDEVLLDTAVLGAPGAVLPILAAPVPAHRLAARRALNRWHRRTATWRPLWLDSEPGSLAAEPEVRSWGRLEPAPGGEILTALCLRSHPADLPGFEVTGRWAVIAQDDVDIRAGTGRVAVIPFDAGRLVLPGGAECTVTGDELEGGVEGWIVGR